MADATANPDPAAQLQEAQDVIRLLNQKLDAMNGPIGQAQTQYWVARYQHEQDLMNASKATLAWQLWASNMLLWVVVLVVAAGVVYSGVQLAIAARTGTQRDTSLEISAQQVRVTSSVVGIVVLAISIAFLLIFVNQVYQIRPLEPAAVSATPAK
jgi:heme/copper-type cytochrome/quinol oxidase subunit 2